MKVWSVSEWTDRLNELGDKPEPEVFKFILDSVTASDVTDEQGQDLLNAFVAWKHIPY